MGEEGLGRSNEGHVHIIKVRSIDTCNVALEFDVQQLDGHVQANGTLSLVEGGVGEDAEAAGDGILRFV